jgi:hypothetical protein
MEWLRLLTLFQAQKEEALENQEALQPLSHKLGCDELISANWKAEEQVESDNNGEMNYEKEKPSCSNLQASTNFTWHTLV